MFIVDFWEKRKKTPNDNIFCTSKAISLNWIRFVKVSVTHEPY